MITRKFKKRKSNNSRTKGGSPLGLIRSARSALTSRMEARRAAAAAAKAERQKASEEAERQQKAMDDLKSLLATPHTKLEELVAALKRADEEGVKGAEMEEAQKKVAERVAEARELQYWGPKLVERAKAQLVTIENHMSGDYPIVVTKGTLYKTSSSWSLANYNNKRKFIIRKDNGEGAETKFIFMYHKNSCILELVHIDKHLITTHHDKNDKLKFIHKEHKFTIRGVQIELINEPGYFVKNFSEHFYPYTTISSTKYLGGVFNAIVQQLNGNGVVESFVNKYKPDDAKFQPPFKASCMRYLDDIKQRDTPGGDAAYALDQVSGVVGDATDVALVASDALPPNMFILWNLLDYALTGGKRKTHKKRKTNKRHKTSKYRKPKTHKKRKFYKRAKNRKTKRLQ